MKAMGPPNLLARQDAVTSFLCPCLQETSHKAAHSRLLLQTMTGNPEQAQTSRTTPHSPTPKQGRDRSSLCHKICQMQAKQQYESMWAANGVMLTSPVVHCPAITAWLGGGHRHGTSTAGVMQWWLFLPGKAQADGAQELCFSLCWDAWLATATLPVQCHGTGTRMLTHCSLWSRAEN